ncbi:adenosylcobinamide-GDP ribazoletransferase [Marinobacter zhejiangensis]|uniref:Adenosylcobinamide-GDP ribazoletransferase n=1 Tax=Marinobacter zhejiangensis TaxID=488535 RepID=A0A1I4M6X6_9GAMM|nr:adenosylcobinamide-GDP ribazoletransferase [Marinobacter zhejiangensis]SFL99032.1 cobalamin-5'-phosphate synthase [Marinobacter zhejiangensis]
MDNHKNFLNREWQAFWLALGFLTRIPMLVRIDYSPQLMNESSVYFPLVGLLLGALYSALYLVLMLVWSPAISIGLVIALHLWLTGAFHEDGLADCADALGGGLTVSDKLRIMKDSRIGTYGTVALVMALGLKAALLLDVPSTAFALLLAPCLARLTPLLLMRYLRYVSDPDKSKSKPVAQSFSADRLLAATVFVVTVGLVASLWSGLILLWATVAIAGTAVVWGKLLQGQLGGYTGDALGASVVISELVLLAGLAAQ